MREGGLSMKVLVTGGAGFIGSHLVRLLQKSGEDVTVVDNFSTGRRENLPNGITCRQVDVTSPALNDVFDEGAFDAVVHLAGQTTVHVSMADPERDGMQNVIGSIHVLEQARRCGVSRVIFASTAASYGDVPEERLPIDESEALSPLSFYGLSKVTVEKYLALYQSAYGLDYDVLRVANVYGERQGIGGEGGVISIFAKKVAQGEPLTIYGDGGQTRDFIYAGDIASGIYAALKTQQVNRAYNLSTQTETSLKELVSVLEQAVGHEIPVSCKEARSGDIYQSVLANGRARRALGWQPEVSLEEGLRRTCRYFKEMQQQ